MGDTSQTGGDQSMLIRHLRELIEALDRRVPHLEREGEDQIASEAAALKQRAQERIAELETVPGSMSTPPKRRR
jgi:hypothetical protein